jgi:hypothetical protein
MTLGSSTPEWLPETPRMHRARSALRAEVRGMQVGNVSSIFNAFTSGFKELDATPQSGASAGAANSRYPNRHFD